VQRRLKSILALWFVLQIVLPFTAPLQTCDLGDLLGRTRYHSSRAPESSTMPTASETESDASAFVSPLESSALRASTDLAVAPQLELSGPFLSTFSLSPSPQVQQTVLRL
jgi:hypothetical protein